MTRVRATVAVSLALAAFAVGALVLSAQPQEIPERSVAKLYPQLCANCHGATLEGGQAPSLLDDTWSFGGDDASVAQSIREGRPGTAMVSFKAALNENEIRAFVIFIREESDKAKRRALTAGSATAGAPPIDAVIQSEEQAFKIETIAEGLDTPWGFAWLPDGRLLVTERAGRLRVIEKGRLQAAPVAGVPPVWVKQDGGLMDIAVHPTFASPDTNWIYLSFSESGTVAGASTTKIVRARLTGTGAATTLVDHQVLFQAPPALFWIDNTHFGSRFLFDKDGHLFYSLGDRGHQDLAQDLGSPYGKLHRINDDGSVPKDNPFVGKAGVVPTIWSYGHRNQQGLVWHPITGELWSTEHGPRGGDELNVVEKAKNYGWPVITYGMNYDGTAVTDKTAQAGMEQPVEYWTPSIATSAIAFYTGDRFPRWKNDLFLCALAGQQFRRLRIDGHKVTHQEILFRGRGRVRDVATGPDGYLYIALNEPGRIVRLVPAP